MRINTILFDLDGTLVDTAPDLAYALNTVLLDSGRAEKPYEQIKPLVAKGGRALIRFGFDWEESHPEFNNQHQNILRIYKDNINRHSEPFAGIDKVLEDIEHKQMFWGVVTNKPQDLTHLLLKKLNLKPDVVVCGDTIEYNKPHPAPLLYACAQLGVMPAQCLFVGDDKNDMIAGKNAQIKTVAVSYGYSKVGKDWGYDYLINQTEELLELI